MINQAEHMNGRDTAELEQELPPWAVKLVRRFMALPFGRHEIIFTNDGRTHDLTVLASGKVEHLG